MGSFLKTLCIAFAAAGLLAGCATRGGDIAYNPANFGAPDPPVSALSLAEYKLSPGDVITVRVLELETLSGDQTVDGTGRVNLPLIGAVPADGMTVSEFQADVARRYDADYLQNANVIVTLKSAVARTVTIDGAVREPGVYAIAPTSTLIQAVAQASGMSSSANPKRVVIFRQIGQERRAAAFDLTTIRTGEDTDPRIYPNDVIVVDGSSLNESYRTLLRSIPLIGLLTRF